MAHPLLGYRSSTKGQQLDSNKYNKRGGHVGGNNKKGDRNMWHHVQTKHKSSNGQERFFSIRHFVLITNEWIASFLSKFGAILVVRAKHHLVVSLNFPST